LEIPGEIIYWENRQAIFLFPLGLDRRRHLLAGIVWYCWYGDIQSSSSAGRFFIASIIGTAQIGTRAPASLVELRKLTINHTVNIFNFFTDGLKNFPLLPEAP